MNCPICGVSMGDVFASIPHYATWPEYAAAVKLHRFDDFAAWRKSHAAWHGLTEAAWKRL